MWRLRHKLFGTNFIAYKWAYSYVITKIIKSPRGKEICETHEGTDIIINETTLASGREYYRIT